MRKLTESDKHEILKLYRETAETTSTLAEHYDVSNSTISRLLKSTLPEEEYEYLVSLKRAARTPEGRAQVSYENLPVFDRSEEIQAEPAAPAIAETVMYSEQQETLFEEPAPLEVVSLPTKSKRLKRQQEELLQEEPAPREVVSPPTKSKRLKRQQEELLQEEPAPREVVEPPSTKSRWVKRRSSAPVEEQREHPVVDVPIAEQLELLEQQAPEITNIPSPLSEDRHPEANVIAEMFGEDLLDESDDLDDLDDDDLDDDDEEYLDEEEYQVAPRLVTRPRSGDTLVRVLPLSAASLPKTCYLVIDRSSELITRPLRDFGDLGHIPSLETQERTLPVFDNHRVAKRFSTKRDRVIKIPDSKMLHKARYHLEAKGITRLLIDGQVYSLSPTTV